MDALGKPPLNFAVVISHKELLPRDPNLIYYPLIYLHGRAAFSFTKEDLDALRRHIEPGGGTLFGDAACGSPAFDAAFRKFVADLLPGSPLDADPPHRRDLHDEGRLRPVRLPVHQGRRRRQGFPSARGGQDQRPLGDHLLQVDIGCALERHSGLDCKGYTNESALKIAANIVIYSTLP